METLKTKFRVISWVVKWDVETFMRCVFGVNDTTREKGACSLEVPMGGRAVIMRTVPMHQRSLVLNSPTTKYVKGQVKTLFIRTIRITLKAMLPSKGEAHQIVEFNSTESSPLC